MTPFQAGWFAGTVTTGIAIALVRLIRAAADVWMEGRADRQPRISEGARRALVRRHGRQEP